MTTWLSLNIGNSRLHWAEFADDRLERTWHTPHLTAAEMQPLIQQLGQTELWIASVVPAQAQLWQFYAAAHLMALDQIPLRGLYPTLGLDRALALWGAVATIGAPVLVIDGGTALTMTGARDDRTLVGGAILPGLRLQFQALGQGTAALPMLPAAAALPPRWAIDTPSAMASGILYTVLAGMRSFVQDWWQQFPGSAVVLTGGDGDRLHRLLLQQFPELESRVKLDPDLIVWGCRSVRQQVRSH
jgi:type III pantothenate kinase